MMPKLAIYIRVHLDVTTPPPKSMTADLVTADGSKVHLPAWDAALIAEGYEEVIANQLPLVGFVLKVAIAPFPIQKTGLVLGTSPV